MGLHGLLHGYLYLYFFTLLSVFAGLLGLKFSREDGGDMFLRNIGLSSNYMTLQFSHRHYRENLKSNLALSLSANRHFLRTLSQTISLPRCSQRREWDVKVKKHLLVSNMSSIALHSHIHQLQPDEYSFSLQQ
jgi:hypothetical protein